MRTKHPSWRVMNEERTRDYLEKSDFSPMQADSLAKVLSDVATTEDLRALETRLNAQFVETRAELREAIAETRSEMKQALAETRSELIQAIADSQTVMMRWGIAMIIAMASIFTLLDVYIN